MKNSKTKISGKQYTIYFDRDVDDIIEEDWDSDVKYNHVDLDIDTKTGKLKISAFFECKRIETAYRRFAKIFDRIAAEVALLTGWNFIPAKKLTQNTYGWENENGDQIFHADGNESLSVDINEDTYYIFGNMSKAVEVSEEIAEINAAEVDTAEYASSEEAMQVAINAEWRNAQVASGNYSLDINDEYVRFENHSIVRIDAMRKMNWIYDHTGANKIFRYGNRKSSAAKVIDMYMNRERADEQGKYFHEFFDQYCKTCGDIVVLVELTYADDREHHFMAEFNQGRLADKFIADVKELAGDTPCQIFKKYRDNHIKPTWEDPHKYETVGNLEHVRTVNYGEETSGDKMQYTNKGNVCYKPTRPLVKTLYFDGGSWYHVKLEQEIVNRERLLFDKDELLVVESGRHAAKIMYLPNDDIAYFVRYLDDRHWYGDFERVDENEFWLAMAERKACTLEPVNNELISADYELADKYNEFGEDTRRFLVNGEIITFCKGRWFEINSPKIRANINRSIYYNKINYNLDEWSHPRYHELSQYHVTAAKFWWSMYKRGFMQRATPFRITIEHDDAPATVHEVTDLYISYTPNGKYYDMFVDDGEIIVLATVDNKRIFDFAESIRLAFANSAGVTIDTKGTVTVIADEDIYILDSCAEINRHAPEGWTITFDTKGKFFPVKFNGKQVTKLDSLATQKFLSPEKFFEQFKPLVDKKFTPRDQFLADRYNELDMLEQMREEIADDDVAQLKTLEEMINQVKRDIAAEEFAC